MAKKIYEMSVGELMNHMTDAQIEGIYRTKLSDYTFNDAVMRIEERKLVSDEDTKNDLANAVANAWTYNGNYDCNLSYWENIDNLIDRFIECNLDEKHYSVKTTDGKQYYVKMWFSSNEPANPENLGCIGIEVYDEHMRELEDLGGELDYEKDTDTLDSKAKDCFKFAGLDVKEYKVTKVLKFFERKAV